MKKTSAQKPEKKVTVVARYTLKRNGHVIYKVRSSQNADTTYCTTIIDGKATGCTCPATKPCYHMIELEKLEAARNPQTSSDQQQETTLAAAAQKRVETSSLYSRPFSLTR